jgi:hypothetical protein
VDWKSLMRALWIPFLLAGPLTACSESPPVTRSPTAPIAPSSPGSGSASGICAGPLDTANTVRGVVSERTPGGIQPISDAIVELFLRDYASILDPHPVKETLTGAAGGYLLCLPPPGGSGAADQPFEVRVRKNGYRTASQSFQYAYSVWDYGDLVVNLELLRD